jgi:glycerol-3-phosphate dehydrogenase
VVTSAARGGLVSAEVEQAVLKEGALRLEDYWARRSSRAWFDEGAGLPVLGEAANRMADLLGWDDARKALEIENCHQIDGASRSGFIESTGWEEVLDDCRAAG